MPSGNFKFNQRGLLLLPDSRQDVAEIIFDELVRSLSDQQLGELMPDDDPTILDALTYELLRLHISHQIHYFSSSTTEVLEMRDGEVTEVLDSLNFTNDVLKSFSRKSVSKFGEFQKSVYDFSNAILHDDYPKFKFFCQILNSLGVSPREIAKLDSVYHGLRKERANLNKKSRGKIPDKPRTLQLRFEPRSSHLDQPIYLMGIVPQWVEPYSKSSVPSEDPEKIKSKDAKVASSLRELFFAYRWCLLLAHACGFSRHKSLLIYDQFRRSPELESLGTSDKHSEYILTDASFPHLRKYRSSKRGNEGAHKDPPFLVEEEISSLSLGWAIEFMHHDYSTLIDWTQFGSEKFDDLFLPQFIARDLAGTVLMAHFQMGMRVTDDWPSGFKKNGKPKTKLATLDNLVRQEVSHPLKVKSDEFAFSYYKKFIKNSRKTTVVHAEDLLNDVVSLSDL